MNLQHDDLVCAYFMTIYHNECVNKNVYAFIIFLLISIRFRADEQDVKQNKKQKTYLRVYPHLKNYFSFLLSVENLYGNRYNTDVLQWCKSKAPLC